MNRLTARAASIGFWLTCITTHAQQPYTLSNTTSPDTLLRDRNGLLLDNETSTQPGNLQGQLVQLGYFSTASDGNLFSGSFNVLAEFQSGDSASGTVDVPNGRISLTAQFTLSLQVTNFPGGTEQKTYSAPSAYPAAGSPLAIRWYDAHTVTGNFNTMSATSWDWVSPTAVPATGINLNPSTAAGLAFQDNSHPFVASVPEPRCFALLLFSALGFLLRRRP
ncbi:MAG: hypothetical protein QOE70_5765 [Chthoniobacter sp.]|jgi:hypothetical protein|nr:hypothetical protein [Chthoniobacter sp.]